MIPQSCGFNVAVNTMVKSFFTPNLWLNGFFNHLPFPFTKLLAPVNRFLRTMSSQFNPSSSVSRNLSTSVWSSYLPLLCYQDLRGLTGSRIEMKRRCCAVQSRIEKDAVTAAEVKHKTQAELDGRTVVVVLQVDKRNLHWASSRVNLRIQSSGESVDRLNRFHLSVSIIFDHQAEQTMVKRAILNWCYKCKLMKCGMKIL